MTSDSRVTQEKGKENIAPLNPSDETDPEESTVRPKFPPEEEAVSHRNTDIITFIHGSKYR